MAGVTLEGFEGRTFDEAYQSFEERVRARLGNGVTFAPQSPESIIFAIAAEEMADVWAMGEAVYLAFDEGAAAGAALDNLAAITGSVRLGAEPSTVVLTATGDAGTVLEVGTVAAVESTDIRFATTEAVTLAPAAAWTQATVYAVGQYVTTSNPSPRVYRCRVAGASSGSGTGPAGTAAVIADGTASWAYVGEGGALAEVDAACTVTGPVPTLAGTLTQKATPVSGWQSVTNVADAVPGRNQETDADFRVRRRRELRGAGKASVAAIRENLADVEQVPGVKAVTVFENDGDLTNADGMPPKSLEALVEGGEDATIREVLWRVKPAGIYTHGTVVGTVSDEGGTHTVRFTRPTILNLYVQAASLRLTPDAPQDDAEVRAQLAAAVVAYGDGLPAGRDVVVSKVTGALSSLSWVHDTGPVLLGLSSGSVAAANVPVTTRQRADFDSARCSFTFTRLTEAQL